MAKELNEVVVAIEDVAQAVDQATADEKLNILDLRVVPGLFAPVKDAAEGISLVPAELAHLSKEEAIEYVSRTVGAFYVLAKALAKLA